MPWSQDDEEINGIIDSNLKDAPPNPPAVNSAATVRALLKSFWAAISGQVSIAIDYVDIQILNLIGSVSNQLSEASEQLTSTLNDVEARTAAAEAKAESVFEQFSLADRLGVYDAASGTYVISETGVSGTIDALPQFPKGKYFDCVNGTTNSIPVPGTTWGKADKLISAITKWDRIPAADTGYAKAVQLEKKVAPNNLNKWPYMFSAKSPTTAEVRNFGGVNELFEWVFYNIKSGTIPLSALSAGLQHSISQIGLVSDGGVTPAKLSLEVQDLIFKRLDPSSGYIFAITTKITKQKLFAIRTDGGVELGKFTLPVSSVGTNNLGDESVSYPKLSLPVRSLIEGGSSNVNDRIVSFDDDLIRSKYFETGVQTTSIGSLFTPLPNWISPNIEGLNGSVSFEIRKMNGLLIRGKSYQGTYSIPGITEGTFRGTVSSNPTTIGRVEGDYFKIGTATGETLTINGQAYSSGDLAVWVSGAFQRKAAPGNGTGLVDHFWIVDVPGIFDGVSYQANDIIYMKSKQASGGPHYKHFLKAREGEYFFMGSFNPATFTNPTVLADGVIYSANTGGTFDAKVFAVNDQMVRKNSSWHKIATEPIITIAANSFFNLKCNNTADYEVRRTDQSASIASFKFKVKSSFIVKTSIQDIEAFGDSMIGALSRLATTLSPRSYTGRAYGGGTSEDVISMMEYLALTSDPAKGKFLIGYFGQNNEGSPERTKNAVMRFLNLRGSRDGRFLFISVLGNRYMSYSGGRMVAVKQEQAFAGAGTLVDIENFYSQVCPGNYINIRKELLSVAATLTQPDLLQPGMTQAQAALNFGHVPLSFFLDYTTLPYPASELSFVGYTTTAAAPTGGTAKDYYIRQHGNTSEFGNLWINVSGTWFEFGWDRIHVTGAARDFYASIVTNWLTVNKL